MWGLGSKFRLIMKFMLEKANVIPQVFGWRQMISKDCVLYFNIHIDSPDRSYKHGKACVAEKF